MPCIHKITQKVMLSGEELERKELYIQGGDFDKCLKEFDKRWEDKRQSNLISKRGCKS